jgi:hypothetical protein
MERLCFGCPLVTFHTAENVWLTTKLTEHTASQTRTSKEDNDT